MSIKGFVRGVDQRLTELERRPVRAGAVGNTSISATMATAICNTNIQDTYWGGQIWRKTKTDLFLLSAAPPLYADTIAGWDMWSVELSGDGYVRQPLDMTATGMSSAYGRAPVQAHSLVDVVFPVNTGTTNWVPITHIAIEDFYNMLWSKLAVPAVVPPGKRLTIPAGSFVLRVASQ